MTPYYGLCPICRSPLFPCQDLCTRCVGAPLEAAMRKVSCGIVVIVLAVIAWYGLVVVR